MWRIFNLSMMEKEIPDHKLFSDSRIYSEREEKKTNLWSQIAKRSPSSPHRKSYKRSNLNHFERKKNGNIKRSFKLKNAKEIWFSY